MIKRRELIKKYLDFFVSKDHKIIPNASLIPENDPTVLFTTAGMHPLIPYLLGQPHPLGKRLCNVQKCIRTTDIEEVGDACHHTFLEMLGNWSLGDYWKKEAIGFSFEFFTKILKLPIEKLAVTCFKGNKNSSKDTESVEIWKSLGIQRIAYLEKDNWWGPAGQTGPCGPSTEIFYWTGKNKVPKEFDPNTSTLATDGGNWIEIGNDVLMQYNKTKKGFEKAKQQNIDFGGGVERTIAVLNGLEDDYKSEVFWPIIKEIEKIYPYKSEGVHMYDKVNSEIRKAMRIIADHIKAATFILAEGIMPSNTEQGYVPRRLIRRAVRYAKKLKIKKSLSHLVNPICKIYPEYKLSSKKITQEIIKEEEKFEKTLDKGLREIKKMAWEITVNEKISGKKAFLLYQSYGFPIGMIREVALEHGVEVDIKEFEKECKKHQELSRKVFAGKFKSGLVDNSKATTKLHTASHLLLAALRVILKDKNIIQKGSNITPERLRLDFSFSRKLTKEELKKTEELVNAQIQKSCEIIKEEMSPKQAKKKGALGIFEKKYRDKVSVYTIEDFSKEICAGPHVKNTCELGHFKIIKEESCGSGIRRIKAVLE